MLQAVEYAPLNPRFFKTCKESEEKCTPDGDLCQRSNHLKFTGATVMG